MLIIYSKETGEFAGINTSPTATFENMYPNVSEEFKQKYGGIVVEPNPDYDKNRNWYKVINDNEVVKLDSPIIKEDTRPIIPDPRDQKIANLEQSMADIKKGMADLQIAAAAILGGAV
jgi:hypothetical protein